MADEEKVNVIEETLKAMGRLKDRSETQEKRIKVLEKMNEGYTQRIDNLENAFREAFTKAQENLQKFLNKASEEDPEPDEVESSDSDSDGDSDSESEDSDSEETEEPKAQIVG